MYHQFIYLFCFFEVRLTEGISPEHLQSMRVQLIQLKHSGVNETKLKRHELAERKNPKRTLLGVHNPYIGVRLYQNKIDHLLGFRFLQVNLV